MIKILYISPVGGGRYLDDMAKIVDAGRRNETIVDLITFPEDRPTHLEYHSYEALVLPDILHHVVAAANKYDAVIIGGYYDVGLREAREVSGNTVVIGPCEATTAIARALGNRFSVIVGRQKWITKMSENVKLYGHQDHMSSMRAVDLGVHDIRSRHDAEQRFLDVGEKCVNDDKAEVLILGCTVEYGFSEVMQTKLQVPVIEAIPAALKYAEMLVDGIKGYGWHTSRKWGSEPPPESEIEKWRLFDGPPPTGRLIRIPDDS